MIDDQRIARLRATVEHLSSPELEGRAPGTQGGRAARRWVEDRFEEIGLQPTGEKGFTQVIPAIGGANLLGGVPGTGSRADRFIVLAAHYDHLGMWSGEIYPGANDNASAVAVLLDVANRISSRGQLDRSLLVCAFDAEEPPYFLSEDMGSVYFVSNPTVPLDHIDLMICLDIVGHALGDESLPVEGRESIFVLGAERAPGVGALVDGINSEGIRPRRLNGDMIPPLSDHFAFEQAGIPYLFFTAGRTRHYHTPDDTAEKLDYHKMAALADYLVQLVEAVSATEVAYESDGRDDPATLTTLMELGTLVAPAMANPEWVAAAMSELEGYLASGHPLPARVRIQLTGLLLELESALA